LSLRDPDNQLSGLPLIAVMFAVLVGGSTPCFAGPMIPPGLKEVGFDQKLDEQVPLDLNFVDETGQPVHLDRYFHERPVVLVLAYFQCPMLCTQVLNGLVLGLRDIPFAAGKEFEVVIVSFDAREKPELAAAKKRAYLNRYDRPGAEAGWHFLTGEPDAIAALTSSVGFRYAYDAKRDLFAHASGIMLLTPEGKISRYFFDVNYHPRDLRLGLMEASEGKIGGRIERAIMLFCFHYDPTAGKYGAAILNIVRAGGVLTMIVLGGFLAFLWRFEKRRAQQLRVAMPAEALDVR
jgi:protein SCO1/2